MTLRKHGPTAPDGSALEFYTLEDVFGGANVAITGNEIMFHLTGGQPGDDTSDPNYIVDDAGPAFETPPVPAPAPGPVGSWCGTAAPDRSCFPRSSAPARLVL